MRATLVDEICKEGDLETYRATLQQILEDIHASGCVVTTRYDITPCNFEYRQGGPALIRVSLKNVRQPLSIIWRLLHEYGHYLSGPKKAGDTTLYREELAWQHAEQLLDNYPDLVLHKKAYQACRERDLQSYRKRFGSSTL